MLYRTISEYEVKKTIIAIGEDKLTRLDGFRSYFYRKSWKHCKANVVQDFFSNRRLLK